MCFAVRGPYARRASATKRVRSNEKSKVRTADTLPINLKPLGDVFLHRSGFLIKKKYIYTHTPHSTVPEDYWQAYLILLILCMLHVSVPRNATVCRAKDSGPEFVLWRFGFHAKALT